MLAKVDERDTIVLECPERRSSTLLAPTERLPERARLNLTTAPNVVLLSQTVAHNGA